MRRHYTRTLTGFKCVLCRKEFHTREDFGQHCGNRKNKCKHPQSLGITISVDISPHHWTKAV